MEKRKIGLAGENWAALFLWLHGVRIIKRNWRSKGFEIDIVGYFYKTIIFVEVKSQLISRKTLYFQPRNRVNTKQKQHLINASNRLLNYSISKQYKTRFDIIEVILKPKQLPSIKWIKAITNE